MHKPNNIPTFAEQKQKTNDGAIAQLVEQRTENPCVPGSIPGGTTEKEEVEISTSSFFCISPHPILFQRDFGVLHRQSHILL